MVGGPVGHWLWSVELHRKLLADTVRNRAFFNAFQRVIKPQHSTVTDLGSGTGFLSFLASRQGAKQCFLYEVDEEISQLSRDLAAANGITNCEFLAVHSSELTEIKVKTDIVVSETMGCFALEENLLENMEEAKRFLKPGGTLIPGRLDQFIAPITSNKNFAELHDPWARLKQDFNLDFHQVKVLSLANMFQRPVLPEELWRGSEKVQRWDSLDFYQKNSSIRSNQVQWIVDEDEVVIKGFCLWWEADLVPGVTLSTSPFAPTTHWQQAYLPALHPLMCKRGDNLRLWIHSNTNYEIGIDLTWKIQIERNGKIIDSIQSRPEEAMEQPTDDLD